RDRQSALRRRLHSSRLLRRSLPGGLLHRLLRRLLGGRLLGGLLGRLLHGLLGDLLGGLPGGGLLRGLLRGLLGNLLRGRLLRRLLHGLLGDLLRRLLGGGLLRDLARCSLAHGLLHGFLRRFLGGLLFRNLLRGHVMALLVSGTCRYYCPVRNTPRVSDPRSTGDARRTSHRIRWPGHPCPWPLREHSALPRTDPSARKKPAAHCAAGRCIRWPGTFAERATPESTLSTNRAVD